MTPRQPRLHDPGFLAFLRTKPCCVCMKSPPSEACHIRMGLTGIGRKPDDSRCVPMCQFHHREQHSVGEYAFWKNLGLDPFEFASRYYAIYGGTGGTSKPPRKIKPRKARGKRTPIQRPPKGRGGAWPKGRKIVSRKTQITNRKET